MWIILKFDKKRLSFLINDFKKNKAFKKEVNLLEDYLFCYYDSFKKFSI